MRKKRFTLVSLLIFCFVLFFGNQSQAEAAELNASTYAIPTLVSEKVKEDWQDYLKIQTTSDNVNILDYYLGTGISVEDEIKKDVSYVFPVINRQTRDISYAIYVSVTADNEPALMISTKLAQKLNSLSKNLDTTSEHSIFLTSDGMNIFYNCDNKRQLLLGNESYSKNTDSLGFGSTNYHSVEVTTKTFDPMKYMQRSQVPEFVDKQVSWFPYETQGDEPWCEFYCEAAIVNNQNAWQITSASQIAHGVFPKATEEQLMDSDFVTNGPDNSIDYMNKTYQLAIKTSDAASFGFDKIQYEIDHRSPIIIGLKYVGEDPDIDTHDICLVGYTIPKNGDFKTYPPFYTYWNPWWEETVKASCECKTLILGGLEYQWDTIQYNYRYHMLPDASN